MTPAERTLLIAIAAVEAEAAPLCEDEGCDHFGTPHICTDGQGPSGPVLQDRVAAPPSEPPQFISVEDLGKTLNELGLQRITVSGSVSLVEGSDDVGVLVFQPEPCPMCGGTGRKK